MGLRVVAFTDTYHPTVNGVTYVVDTWSTYWNRNFGQMDVVYPGTQEYDPRHNEYPVPSVPFPFYSGYRSAAPWITSDVSDADVVHVHSLFSLGFAGWVHAQRSKLSLVASYHTPMAEYSNYVTSTECAARLLGVAMERYERFALNQTEFVITPSVSTKEYIQHTLGVKTPVSVISNGVDLEYFRQVPSTKFRQRYDLDRPIIGYTGRHGREKELQDIFKAVDELDQDATVVLGGDGPDNDRLQRLAQEHDADVRFIGFLDRHELPEFYSALDVFTFPSPMETEGIVAMESIACGTPVVGVNTGGLSTTIECGVTGYHYTENDIKEFAERISQALDKQELLSENCLKKRETFDVKRSLEKARKIYRLL